MVTDQARGRRRKAARPDEIRDAAMALFVEKGFAATRMDEVARRAGVSKGTVYLYFENKEALLRSVVEEVVEPALARAEAELDAYHGSARELIEALVRQWWSMVGQSRLSGLPKLMVSEARNFPELARYFSERVVRRTRALFQRAIALGVARGEFAPDLDVEACARLAMAPLVYAAIWRHSLACCGDEDFDPQRFIEAHLRVFLAGLGCRVQEGRDGR